MTSKSKTILVCGAGGFIGHHLVRKLKQEGHWVRGTDLKFPRFADTQADDFAIGDLREQSFVREVIDRRFDEVYQLAADMGGAGYIFTGENDADVMHNSATINLNVLNACQKRNTKRIFYSSSACIYPEYNQLEPDNPNCAEESAYPAAPDSEYGWEKLFSERLYLAYARNYGMQVRVARYHNIFGPEGSWNDGKEKAPAAICRKVSQATNGGEVEIWGDGKQTRSFLYIDECIEGTLRLMRSDWTGPVNIGSDEMVTINQLVDMVAEIAGKTLRKHHIEGPTGVRGRNIDADDFIDEFSALAEIGSSAYCCVPDAYQCMIGYDLKSHRDIVNAADFVVSDSVVMQRARGFVHGVRPARTIRGYEIMLGLCEQAQRRDTPIALIGGKDDAVLAQIIASLIERFPRLQVVYGYSPPFRPLTDAEETAMLADLAKSGARLVFVGIGCPKQEQWMGRYKGRIAAAMIGIGAAFDMIGGIVEPSPTFIHRSGFEWLYRLLKEPRRLYRRYLLSAPRFLTLVIAQRLGAKLHKL